MANSSYGLSNAKPSKSAVLAVNFAPLYPSYRF